MEQLINSMLANAQFPQMAPAAKKGESTQKDSFQTLLEQKQSDSAAAPKQEKADAPQKPQETQQDTQKAPEAEQRPQEAQPAAKDGKELEEQMVLAAMAMLQNPVVPAEQAEMTPEIQAEAVVDEIAPIVAETVLTAEDQGFVPETERTVETAVEGGEAQTAEQPLAEELPQAIEAPEAAQETEGRTVEVKVETGRAEAQAEQAGEDTDDTPELQDAGVETPVFEDVKEVPVKVGEAPKAESPEEPIMKEQIAPKLTEALQNGETHVELQLTPENLGKVTVEMSWSKDGGLVVQLHAENSRTQNLLSKDTEGLAQLLGRETQQEVRVEVPRQEESQRQDLYEQQQEQRQRQQRQEERRKRQTSPEDFLQQLRLGLIPLDGE